MALSGENALALSDTQVDSFIRDGFVRIENAFPEAYANEAREILWRDSGCERTDPSTWTKPVVRLGMYHERPFVEAANTPLLHGAFDQLVGANRWAPCQAMGTFPIRFPSSADPGDTGWHIDVSFGFDAPDFMSWRANVFSKGRALLMLFLFSDIDDNDAPTRVRVGSHMQIAKQLEPFGEAGLSLRELAANGFAESAGCAEVLATGHAGTVYLCHPFLVHSAQMHRGLRPRFMAQPPLLPREAFVLERPFHELSPVERAIRLALGR